MNFLITMIISSILLLVGPADEITTGSVAPDFNLKNVDESMISLYKDFKDEKGVILVFTCNTCPFSIKYEDRIIALDNKYRDMGYPVVAINPNDVNIKPGDSFDEMVERSDEKDFPFHYLYDETQEVAEAYGASRTPHVYLLQNMDGKFNVAYIGAIDNNTESASAATKMYVDDAITALENGDLPNPDFTKAIGCTIKWKVQ